MSLVTLENCICIGGDGYPIASGTVCLLALSQRTISVRADPPSSFEIPMLEVSEVQITGPGVVTMGGGFIGGGFGVEGAIKGIAVAAVLNMLTTVSRIHTFISFVTNEGELHFHYGGMEPSALRVALAGTFATLRRLNPGWQYSRLAVLKLALEQGEIGEGEYQRLKERLTRPTGVPRGSSLGGLVPPADQRQMGYCPSCKSIIPFESEECPVCNASFDEYSSWKIIPV